VIAALALGMALAAPPPPPTYIVERVIRIGDEVRRTSVFRNGVAVVVREKGGTRTHFARQALTEVELRVIVQVTDEAYADVKGYAGPLEGPGIGTVELRLAPPGREPLTVRFPVSSVEVLGAAHIGQALDGLEAEMDRFHGAREDLREWVPRVGERVALEDGRVVQIIEVLYSEKGVVFHLQIGDGPASIFMSEEELRRVAVRRVER
jgi:hypothetical protein